MNPYENAAINQPGTRPGNGSAHDLLNLIGNPFQSGTSQQANPGFSQHSFMQQPPFAQQSYFNQPWQPSQQFSQPWQQQSQQPWQQNFGQQPLPSNPFQQQSNPFQQPTYPFQQNLGWQQQNPFLGGGFGQVYGQGIHPQQQMNLQQQPFFGQHALGQHPGVVTTKSVELSVNIPIYRVIGKHPAEVQQYLLQVVLPVLLDGLTKRAITSDTGHSITSDQRECVVRIEI